MTYQEQARALRPIIEKAVATGDLTDEQKIHTVRLVRAFLQGFSTIEAHTAQNKPVPLDDSFDFALRTILRGIADMQKKQL